LNAANNILLKGIKEHSIGSAIQWTPTPHSCCCCAALDGQASKKSLRLFVVNEPVVGTNLKIEKEMQPHFFNNYDKVNPGKPMTLVMGN